MSEQIQRKPTNSEKQVEDSPRLPEAVKAALHAPPPVQEAPQTMQAFIVPAGAMQQVRDCIRQAPEIHATPILQFLNTLQVMNVPIQKNPRD